MYAHVVNNVVVDAFAELPKCIAHPVKPVVVTGLLYLSQTELEELGLYPVTIDPKPSYDADTQRLRRLDPVFSGGVVTVGWEVVGLTTEELQTKATHDHATRIETKASDAITSNQAYLALSPPTNAEIRDQVEALTRQVNNVIRFIFNRLDGVD